MYTAHFGFTQAPFERELPTELLYDSPCFSEALARLLYVCKKRTLALITGEAGSGKSALLRLLGSRLDTNAYLYSYIADSSLTPRNFYFHSLSAMGLSPLGHLVKLKSLFKQALLDLYENKGKITVIAIDEAQTLEASMLFELRFVMNFNYDSFSPLAIILVGETSLRTTLRAYHMSAIWRRVETGYHLSALGFEQTKGYINHQLKSAGCNRPLFPDDVISRIQEKSKGMPAYINTLCRGCLLDAFTRKQELIDGENLARVLTDLS